MSVCPWHTDMTSVSDTLNIGIHWTRSVNPLTLWLLILLALWWYVCWLITYSGNISKAPEWRPNCSIIDDWGSMGAARKTYRRNGISEVRSDQNHTLAIIVFSLYTMYMSIIFMPCIRIWIPKRRNILFIWYKWPLKSFDINEGLSLVSGCKILL